MIVDLLEMLKENTFCVKTTTGQTCNIQLNKQRKAYKKGDHLSKLLFHSHEIDHKPYFYNLQILESNCRNYSRRILLGDGF